MCGSATAACCSCGPIRARARRWCSTPTTGRFAFFKGACTRGIYDNMKTAVETIFVGKERAYNRRFLQMCSHYLVDPVACTPASGWEKGQVENQVGLVRERFFTPRLRVKSYDELNAWLLDQCDRLCQGASPSRADATRRSGRRSKPSGRASFPMPAASTASTRCRHRCRRPAWCASTTTSTRSRRARSAGRSRSAPMPTGSSCARTAASSASIARSFGRDQTVFDPWHYVPVLARKPGALRNGAPFKDWVLPAALDRVRRKLAGAERWRPADGRHPDRGAERRLAGGRGRLRRGADARASTRPTSSSTSWPGAASRQPPITIMTPDALRLRHEPVADCARYDSLRRAV